MDEQAFAMRRQQMDAGLMEEAAEQTDRLLAAAEEYVRAFKMEPGDYFPGINALTLTMLYHHLADEDELADADLPDVADLRGGVSWALGCAVEQEKAKWRSQSFWTLATQAELALMSNASDKEVKRRYRRAASSDQADWFAIDSARQQVVLLRQVGYRRDLCDEVIASLTSERNKLEHPAGPGQVVLFAGHMIDSAERETPRFPAAKEDAAAARIEDELEKPGHRRKRPRGNRCGLRRGSVVPRSGPGAGCQGHGSLCRRNGPSFLEASVTFADREANGTRWQNSYKTDRTG